MRTNILILLSILWLNTYSQTKPVAFDTKINSSLSFNQLMIYKVTFVGDSSLVNKKFTEDCFLFVNNSTSLSESSTNFEIIKKDDVKINRLEKGFNKLTWAIIKTNDAIITFDSFSEDRNEQGDINFKFSEKINLFQWVLQKDTATIQNFKCQKATTNFAGRDWEAWFCPEIPITSGPYKFQGLPGLIISINDNQNHWNFDLTEIISFEIPIEVSVAKYLQYQMTSKLKFFKNKRLYIKNYFQAQEASGIGFINPENREIMKKNIEFGFKQRSNWIERYP